MYIYLLELYYVCAEVMERVLTICLLLYRVVGTGVVDFGLLFVLSV